MAEETREKLSSERGQEAFVKEQQYYLLYRITDILREAWRYGHLTKAFEKAPKRLKALNFKDDEANYKFSGTLARTQNIQYLRKIPPNVLSGLMPRIKVYKVVYPYRLSQNSITLPLLTKEQFEKQEIVEIPFDHGIIPVSYYEGSSEEEKIKSFLDGRPKGFLDLANLVSFNYQFIGTNPAEVEACITANMKLKFQTIDALLEERILQYASLTNAPNFGLNPDGTVASVGFKDIDQPIKFKYADLVNQGLNSSPQYYRLKIEVGYAPVTQEYIENLLLDGTNTREQFVPVGAPDEEAINTNSFKEFCKNLTNAINDSTILMFIYPVRHEINFTENGTIELNVDFHGAVEQIMSSKQTDVLLTSVEGRAIIERIKQLEKTKNEKIADLETKISRNEGDIELLKRDKEQQEKNFEREIKQQTEKVSIIYKSFIDSIYKQGLIKSIAYDPNKLMIERNNVTADTIEVDVKKAGDARKDRSKAPQEPSGNLKYNEENAEFITARANNLKTEIEKTSEPRVGVDTKDDKGRLRFMFLQDLIAQAMSNLDLTELATEDFFVVLGNMVIPIAKEYRDAVVTTNITSPGTFFDGAVTFQENNSYGVLLNIGMLPISLEFFNKWFFETVVKPGKKEYNLKTFLYDIIDLVRISCLQMFGDQTYSLAGSRLLSSITSVDKSYGNEIRNVPSIDLRNLSGKVKVIDPRQVTNVMYLFSPSTLASTINPLDTSTNDKKNIFTFIVGSSAGLLKRISYKKMEIPGMREARALQEGELATGTLRMKYDADIEMYGPCYFRPGDYIIINPIFLSKNALGTSVTLLANDLGLGGVYMVLKTNTEASRDGLTTRLDTVFQNYGSLVPRTVPTG